MGYTVNGVGTEVIPGVGFVRWGDEEDCDGVECFVIVHLPVIPYGVVHTFEWNGSQYRCFPIRWSLGLVARAFARRWLWLPMVLGIFAVLFGGSSLSDGWGKGPTNRQYRSGIQFLAWGAGLTAVAMAGWKVLAMVDRRDAGIRRVLGPHGRGSSDPATWLPADLESLKSAEELFGKPRFLDCTSELLAAGRFGDAMWAARCAVAREDARRGEAETDRILRDTRVAAALRAVEAAPARWGELMAGPPAAAPEDAAAGAGA